MSTRMPEPSHREIQGLLGVYALDAVDPETATMVEQHLLHCVKCSTEVAQHHEVAGLLANSGGASPAGLWDGIASQLDGSVPPSWDRLAARLTSGEGRDDRLVGQGDGGADVVPIASARRSRWVIGAASAVAAAAAVVAVLLGVQVNHLHTQVHAIQTHPLLSAAEQAALKQPSTKQVTLTSLPGARSPSAVTVVLTHAGTGFVEADRLGALPAGKTYQLWGVIGGKTISLGLLGPDPSVVPFSVAGDGSVQAFAITAEHAGGVVQSTNQPVVSGEVTA
jgi:anti-sigma factor RsiW